MTFLQKPYRDYSKVEKFVLVTKSYEESDKKAELELVPIINQHNNNFNVVVDAKTESYDESEEHFFNKNIDKEVEGAPKTTINAIKKLQALYNNDANKIMEQAS